MFLFYFTTIYYIIKTGSDLMTFGLFKEWAEDTVFLFREDHEEGGDVVMTVDIKINFELAWPLQGLQ